jgi:putative transposase
MQAWPTPSLHANSLTAICVGTCPPSQLPLHVAYAPHEQTTWNQPIQASLLPSRHVSHCVWLYFRFCLSHRDVEELMAERGVIVTYEAVRYWCRKFGQAYTNQLRRRRPQPGGKQHLDEMFLTINGKRAYLWRTVNQDGNVLNSLVQHQRDNIAAKTFFRKLLKGLRYISRVIITDKLASYRAAKREILPGMEHRQYRYLNNRAENSH